MKPSDPRVDFFDALAANWDNEEPSVQSMQERLGLHRSLLDLRPGQDLLEVGCGTGKITAWLSGQVAPGRVMAIDFSAKMIAQARAKGISARFVCLDVCSDDLGERRYDVVLCFHSFPHFRDPAAALRNLARAMKPRGRLIVMHLAGSEHINQFHASIDGPVKGDMLPVGDQWPPLLQAAGLRQARRIDRRDLFFLEALAAGEPWR